MAGALATWAGIENVVHLLQILKIIGYDRRPDYKKDRAKPAKSEHPKPTIIDPGVVLVQQEERKESVPFLTKSDSKTDNSVSDKNE